ncbi:MAG TPA: cyclic nucleotide-binding domain-containing protein [Fontimonas sp.]
MLFEQPVIHRVIAMAAKQSFRPRQLIVRGTEARNVYLMLEGSAALIVEHEEGEQAILDLFHPGDFFGETTLCTPRLPSMTLVRARSSALVASVNAEDFRRLVMQEPDLALCLVGQLSTRIEGGYRRTADHFFLDVTARLLRTLRRLAGTPEAQRTSDGMALRINRLELAAMLGCSREMIARGLRTLENDGLVVIDGHDIVVRPDDTKATLKASRAAD